MQRRPMRGRVLACVVIFAPLSTAHAAEYERPFATPSFVVFIDPTTIVDIAHDHRRFVQSEVRVASVTHVRSKLTAMASAFSFEEQNAIRSMASLLTRWLRTL